MRILVLGASGFVGRNVAEYFATKGHEVMRHGNTRPADIQADLCLPNAVDYTGVGVVIQCAAATSGCKDTLLDPALHIAKNAIMNSYILKEATAAGVKHVIFPSCSVMYQSSDTLLKESDLDFNVPLNPAYLGFASTKLYCEKLCEFYAGLGNTRFTVMRNSNFYGPYDKYDPDRSHVFGATVRKVMSAPEEGGAITVWGTGEEKRDFLHIDNFCTFVEAAIERQTAKYALYNVGSGVAVSINELVQAIINHAGKQGLTVEHDTTQPTIPTAFSLDTTKAREELGWESTVGMFEGIGRTLDWYRANVIL